MESLTTTADNQDTAASHKAIQMEQVGRMLDSLRDLRLTPIATQEVRDRTITTTRSLSKPAPRAWVQGEVAKALVHYFAGVIPPNFAKSIGADYDAELAEFPAWAIVKARRWWLSRENRYRHRKPLPGDLGDHARHETAILRYAEYAVEVFDRTGPQKAPETPRSPPSPEEMERRRAQVAKLTERAVRGSEPPKQQSQAQTQKNTNMASDAIDTVQ